MKIFERDGKINFVDDNNVFVGFDYGQDCCESFGWSLGTEFPPRQVEGANGIDPEGFNFDIDYFDDNPPEVDVYDGGAAVFRLAKGEEAIFLMLWNCHNGYYSHGFAMKIGDQIVKEGYL